MKAYLEPAEIEMMERVTRCLRDRLLIRILFRLGCRVSEALALKVSDIDFEQGTVTILHLKTRIRLSCPKCKAGLGRRHQFCPECGEEVNKARKRQQEHRCIRTLPVDRDTLEMLRDYIDNNQATRTASRCFNNVSFIILPKRPLVDMANRSYVSRLLFSDSYHMRLLTVKL